MFQCSGSSSVCLTTFLLEAAADASVETLFPKKKINNGLGQATRPSQSTVVSPVSAADWVKGPFLTFDLTCGLKKTSTPP